MNIICRSKEKRKLFHSRFSTRCMQLQLWFTFVCRQRWSIYNERFLSRVASRIRCLTNVAKWWIERKSFLLLKISLLLSCNKHVRKQLVISFVEPREIYFCKFLLRRCVDPTQCKLLIVLQVSPVKNLISIHFKYDSNMNDVFTQKSSRNFSRRLREIYDLFEMFFLGNTKWICKLEWNFIWKVELMFSSLEEATKSALSCSQVKARKAGRSRREKSIKKLLSLWFMLMHFLLFSIPRRDFIKTK